MKTKTELNDKDLNKVSGGLTKEEVEEQLFKPGDWLNNSSGYYYKIVKVNSIDYNNVGNSVYEIEVWFLRNTHEKNDTRKHSQLINYKKC